MAFDLHGRGSDLAITVSAASAAACLAAAIEGFAASVGRARDDADRRHDVLALRADDTPTLLVDLMDEAILRLDADGELAVALIDPVVDDGALDATLELVALADVDVHGDPPKAATWHDLRLEETVDGWRGHVLLDL